MQRMLSSSQDKEFSAKLALVAFHEGVLDSAQLRRCVRIWLERPETDMLDLLTDEFAVGSSTIDQLREQLAVLHPEHKLNGPHLSFHDKDKIESLPHAQASGSSNIAQSLSPNLGDGEEQLGDEELSKRSKRGKSKGGERPTSVDYYDSVHERFTRDDRLIPYLFQTAAAYRRKLVMDFRRSWRSLKSLIANFRDWLRLNWRNASIATLALIIFVPACIFLSQFISPKPSKLSAKNPPSKTTASDSVEDAKGSDDSPSADSSGSSERKPSQGRVSAEDRVAAIDRALSSRQVEPSRSDAGAGMSNEDPSPPPAESRLAGSNDIVTPDKSGTDSVPSNTVAALDVESSVEPMEVADPKPPQVDKAEQLRLALQRGSELLKRRQFGRASVILKNARIELPDSKELGKMLVISQLASRDYDQAGSLLAEEHLANAEDPVWQMLFAVWLLEAPQSSRAAVRGELLTLVSLRPPTDILRRCIAWIDAREGKGKEAVAVLGSKPIFGERSFADALFYCAALSKIAKKPEARKQLEFAKNEFGERERKMRTQASPDSPSYYAAIMASPKIAATINSFAAKLR